MPNWCSNSIAFYQEDGGTCLLEPLFMEIGKYINHIDPETNRNCDWVGHFLKSSKIDPESLSSRGFFQNCELNSDHVRVDMDTAWSPLPEVWDKIAETYGLSYVYISEECGCAVYVNTDVEGRFFSDRYLLDYFCVDDLRLDSNILAKYEEQLRKLEGETTYYDDFDDVLNDFKELGFCGDNIEDLNKHLEQFNIEVYEYRTE
jgi:hypothetical protein